MGWEENPGCGGECQLQEGSGPREEIRQEMGGAYGTWLLLRLQEPDLTVWPLTTRHVGSQEPEEAQNNELGISSERSPAQA